MSWKGDKVKIRAKEVGVKIQDLAMHIGVSRQTVNLWIRGHMPKGQHLIKLSRALGVKSEYFFSVDRESLVSVPQLFYSRVF